ncbi:MAG: hypothetical protein ACK4K2_05110 [Dehalococcoidia bacterium]
MPVLRDADRTYLQGIFNRNLREPVTLTFFTQRDSPLETPISPCATCREAEEVLQELAGLHEKIRLEVKDLVANAKEAQGYRLDNRLPALVLHSPARQGLLRYFGVPAGYEFAVLVETIVDLSKGTTRLSPVSRGKIASLTKPVHIQVMVTPT